MAAFPSPRRDPRTRSESPFPTLPVGDATGPIRTFATLSSVAAQLHQTGHSPRAQNLEVCGLTLSRQGCDPLLQWMSTTMGVDDNRVCRCRRDVAFAGILPLRSKVSQST